MDLIHSKRKFILQSTLFGVLLPACFSVPIYFSVPNTPIQAIWLPCLIGGLFACLVSGFFVWTDE